MNFIFNPPKILFLLGAIAFSMSLVACGDKTSVSEADSKPKGSSKKIYEFSYSDMPKCISKREGLLVYATDMDEYYRCEDGDWIRKTESDVEKSLQGDSSDDDVCDDDDCTDDGCVNDDCIDDDRSSSASNRNSSSDGSEKGRSSVAGGVNSSSSANSDLPVLSSSEEDIPGRVLYGYAEAFPFKKGAEVRVNPLTEKLRPREDIGYFYGETYNEGIGDSSGFYKVRGISENVDFVEVRVIGWDSRGKSEQKDTLYALANLKNSDYVNVNVLTTGTYKRIKYLVQNKNMAFEDAKKQAESEYLKVFFIASKISDFETLRVYSCDTTNWRVTLLPASVTNIVKTIPNEFRLDTQTSFIENAECPPKNSVKKYIYYNIYHVSGGYRGVIWKIHPLQNKIGAMMETFINNYVGRGHCLPDRQGVVAPAIEDTIPSYYICKTSWEVATLYELNTYSLDHPCTEIGFSKGAVTDDPYFCLSDGSWIDGTSWDKRLPAVYRLNPDIEYGEMTDERDGKVYKTVKIGEKTWMAQNLNFQNYTTDVEKDDSLVANMKGKYRCYNDSSDYCKVCGTLYRWQAAMNIKVTRDSAAMEAQIKEKHQGVCPAGWHISTLDEWRALDPGYTWDSNTISDRVRSSTGWGRVFPDSLGLSVLPCGRYLDSFNMGLVADHMGSSSYYFASDGKVGERWVHVQPASFHNAVLDRFDMEFGFGDYLYVRCVMDD